MPECYSTSIHMTPSANNSKQAKLLRQKTKKDKYKDKHKHKDLYCHDTGKHARLFSACQCEMELVLILLIPHCAKSVEKQH